MKKMYHYFTLFAFFVAINYNQAQDAGDQIYNNSILHEIHFEFENVNYWSIMTSNYENAPEGGPVPYLMGKVTIDDLVVDSVGVRFKGFTSYTGDNKKPIKIDFNEFVQGKKYDGLTKMNLNNGTGDPSMQRDVVCYDLLRNTGVKAPRTSYSKVYFNGIYWGLYQNIEQVDKAFLNRNFSNGKGNLFKNKGWSHFEWNGTNAAVYHPPFELKTNEEGNDWSGFVNLMDVLNNSSDEDFAVAIEEIFNVNLYLKTLAVDVATDNWDSYLQHGRNWYIYEDTTTGVFNWIPWDYNFALAGGFFGGPSEEECIVFSDFWGYTNGTTTVDFFNTSFYLGSTDYLWDFGDGSSVTIKSPAHTYETHGTYNVCLTVNISPTCSEQFCQTINTTVDEECESITNGSSPHPVSAAFLQVVGWIPACCDEWGQSCEELYIEITGQNGGVGGANFPINQQENEGILIKRLLNVPEFNNRYYTYFCDLLNYQMTEDHLFALIDHNSALIADAVEDDPNFLFSFEEFTADIGINSDTTGLKNFLSERIDSLNVELETLISCPTYISAVPWNDVVVNEFVASTDSTNTIMDPADEIEDWIELYNNTTSDIDLTGVYFSDDIANAQKWQFPTGTMIPAEGYLIVWADKDEEQEGLHTNFKLKKTGEQLVLSNSDGAMIDSLTFGEQTVNIASARRPNGTGDFVLQAATHNFNNEEVSGVFDLNKKLNVSIYPVPANEYIAVNIQNDGYADYTVKIFTVTGQLMLRQKQNTAAFRIDVKNWKEGFYLLQIVDKEGNAKTQKFIINH